MQNVDLFVFARALHVICVILWIGGVGFVTTVLIPAVRRIAEPDERLALFERLEQAFSFQAKLTTLLTGFSGAYMLSFIQGWEHFLQLQYWWLQLMTLVWLIFTLVLFVFEPWFLHRWFHLQALKDSDRAFTLLHRMHKILLVLSLLAAAGAVAGAHGFHFG
ncbi:hypothetical protein [Shewanella salipaludis]|uniref:Copper resistance protein D domain-containing protein n=1 Tax=Shewanella salipaludis TaxID=2723052 RepID=A0A972JN31_9GAMM|nr:hypothetical protein [Shewanella salipaludis]NMH67132.1 hypothetical protein [Shewanella salipaludis]